MPSRHSLLISFAIVALFVGLSSHSFALWVAVSKPDEIAYSLRAPEKVKRQVAEALTLKECEFIDGGWCNGTTIINFCGDTAALNAMAARLAECPEMTVEVSFKRYDRDSNGKQPHKKQNPLERASDWRLVHESRTDSFHFVVNLESENIHLEDLKIPPAKGPKLVP